MVTHIVSNLIVDRRAGGEIGSNGPPEPTLEILPTPVGANTTIYLDWLQHTDPNNLYPFLFVLPSGNIFVGQFFIISVVMS